MSSGHQGNGTQSFGDSEALALAVQNERKNMNVQTYGEVVMFTASTQTATVRVLRKPSFNGVTVDIPDLVNVPVHQPRSSGFCVTFPVKAGDKVLLRFDDKDNKAYLSTGEASTPSTDRMNSLSDATAELTGYPQTQALPNYDAENLFIGREDGTNGITMDEEGKVSVTANGQELITILDELLERLGSETTTVSYGSSGGVHSITGQSVYNTLRTRLAQLKRL